MLHRSQTPTVSPGDAQNRTPTPTVVLRHNISACSVPITSVGHNDQTVCRLVAGLAAALITLAGPPVQVAHAGFWDRKADGISTAVDTATMQAIQQELQEQPAPATSRASDAMPTAKKSTNPKEKLNKDNLSALLGLPKDKAKDLLAREKQLGKLPLVQAEASQAYLNDLLASTATAPSPASAATVLVIKQPKLLLVAARDLADRFLELQALTRASREVAAGMVVSQPGLLTHASGTLQGRLANLTSVFNVDVSLAQVGGSAQYPGQHACQDDVAKACAQDPAYRTCPCASHQLRQAVVGDTIADSVHC